MRFSNLRSRNPALDLKIAPHRPAAGERAARRAVYQALEGRVYDQVVGGAQLWMCAGLSTGVTAARDELSTAAVLA